LCGHEKNLIIVRFEGCTIDPDGHFIFCGDYADDDENYDDNDHMCPLECDHCTDHIDIHIANPVKTVCNNCYKNRRKKNEEDKYSLIKLYRMKEPTVDELKLRVTKLAKLATDQKVLIDSLAKDLSEREYADWLRGD
jgi:hypothetical protein